jgi:putative DNA primase/helicase
MKNENGTLTHLKTFDIKNVGNIPAELKQLRQWICWKEEIVDGKTKKVPVNPENGRNARTIDSSTWRDFDSALATSTNVDGIGFVFTEGDEFVGVDLDHVLNPETGELDPEAHEIVRLLDSYTEISQSGKGLHVFVKGKLQGSGRRKGNIEIYDRGRYFCMTGQWFAGTPITIRACQPEIDEVYRLFSDRDTAVRRDGCSPAEKPKQQEPAQSRLPRKVESDDAKLLARACKAGNGKKFRRLYYTGVWKGEYTTQSEADQALCAILAFWCHHDAPRIDRLFRRSQLYRPKWDKYNGKWTYGQITVYNAIQDHLEFLQEIAVNQNKDPIEVFACEVMRAIDLSPWKGRSGATDLQVLKAHLGIVLDSRQLIHHADVRTIGEKAGLLSLNTVSQSHTRLNDRQWLKLISVHKKGTSKANTYKLTIPSYLKDLLTGPSNASTTPPSVLECSSDERSLELWISNKGLGKTKQKIWEQLDETDGQTGNDLARRNCVKPATMRKHLNTLASYELADYDSGLWYQGNKEPSEVATQLGISGILERQKILHQEQREARNYLLSMRPNRADSTRLILKPDLINCASEAQSNTSILQDI